MKPRRVVVTMELETTESMSELRSWVKNEFGFENSLDGEFCRVKQLQVNVIGPVEEKKPKAKRQPILSPDPLPE